MSAALAYSEPLAPPAPDRHPSAAGASLFQMTMRIALGLTEASGNLADASTQLDEQAGSIHAVVAATQQMSAANRLVADKLSAVGEKAHHIGHGVAEATARIADGMTAARVNVSDLARAANEIDVQVMAAGTQVSDLRKSSYGIQNIAREIQLLAVNAGVEAARHGASGRGFAVIAEAVKKLADQTRSATDQTEKHLVKLAATMERLQSQGHANLTSARTADTEMAAAEGRLQELMNGREALVSIVQELERSVPHVEANAEACRSVLGTLRSGAARIDQASSGIGSAVERFQRLVSLSEDMGGLLLSSSSDLPASGLADACAASARAVSDIFDAGVKSGRIRMDHLFDERYRPIEGSNPAQFLTSFTAFTDQTLPDLQEALLASDRRILFCAAADRNGYLPTHNRKFSQAQGNDPAWNAQHSRNRRIFDDRTSLASVRNRKPVLLQTYRRDMGGGNYAVINELASPIIVGGRQWGGFRRAGWAAGGPSRRRSPAPRDAGGAACAASCRPGPHRRVASGAPVGAGAADPGRRDARGRGPRIARRRAQPLLRLHAGLRGLRDGRRQRTLHGGVLLMRILAIDDTKSLRDLLVATLRQAGHDVVEAADGREGLEQLEAHRPELVISDLNMPHCDGIEFTREARQRPQGEGIPIIILTTESDPAIKAQGRKAGATAWMIKPFDPPTLLGLLNRFAA